MRESIRKWHNKVIALHNSNMFESLVYGHNIVTEICKSISLEDKDGHEQEPCKGYFAVKDIDGKRKKFFIPDDIYKHLPIRVDSSDEMLYKDSARSKSVIYLPTTITPFRITAENVFPDMHEFIDNFCPYTHTNPDVYTLMKMITIASDVGKTCLGISSESEFGKSSVFITMDAITQKSPVFKPRSVPGMLRQITSDGNMVFDETHDVDTTTKRCIEELSLNVGGDDPIYINGAMRSKGLKQKYDISHQSITFLYNLYSYYKNPEKEFFDRTFSNNEAMDSRFLKLKMDGILTEKFDKEFNMIDEAEKNKMFYMKIAKQLLYLKQLKLSNKYVRRYNHSSSLKLNGRKKSSYNEITWVMDLYSRTQEEYAKFIGVLDKSILDYSEMIGRTSIVVTSTPQTQLAEEEFVEDAPGEQILAHLLKRSTSIDVTALEVVFPNFNVDDELKGLAQKGDVFFTKPGFVEALR